jgi:hypothetical protein
LCHGDEHLVLAPERVDDVGLPELQRRVEPTSRGGLFGELADPCSRVTLRGVTLRGVTLRDKGIEPVDPTVEVGEVAEGSHLAKGFGVHHSDTSAVIAGSGQYQIGLGDEGWSEISRPESGGVAAVRQQLCGCTLVHGRPGAGAVHEDALCEASVDARPAGAAGVAR